MKYVVMAEQEWQELNSTCGNNGRNLREISKHQELSCGNSYRYICEIINFPRFYYFTTGSITDHTTELEASSSLLPVTRDPAFSDSFYTKLTETDPTIGNEIKFSWI